MRSPRTWRAPALLAAGLAAAAATGGDEAPETQPATRPKTPKVEQPRTEVQLLAAVRQAGLPEELKEQYPQLQRSIEGHLQQRNRRVSERIASRPAWKAEFIGVVPRETCAEMVRCLKAYLRSERHPHDREAYPAGHFAGLTGLLPEGTCFVLASGFRGPEFFRFERHQGEKTTTRPERAWVGRNLGIARKCLRLGAAVALVEDMLTTAAQGKPIADYGRSRDLRWPLVKPTQWRLIQEEADGEPFGLGWTEFSLQGPRHGSAKFALWVRAGGRKQGLEVHLRRDRSRKGYCGWRVSQLRTTRHPEPFARQHGR